MKNKLGIFTALILSLVIAGSAFALPKTANVKKGGVSNAKVTKTTKKKHHKKKAVKKNTKKAPAKTSTTPTKNK